MLFNHKMNSLMIKLRFVIIFIFLSSFAVSQNVYELRDYKLSTIDFTKYQSKRFIKDNILVTVTPNTSKYPISNFITDIIFAGDTVWFATGSGIMRTIDNFQNFQNYFGATAFR